MDDSDDFVDRSPGYIGREDLFDFCGDGGGFEILAEMVEVNPNTKEIEVIPRSRQELLQATDVKKNAVDDRCEEGVEELDILISKSGEDYDHLDDLVRVFELKRGRISDEHLREIKKKGWFRYREDEFENVHANAEGGESIFLPLPDWSSFVDQHLHG